MAIIEYFEKNAQSLRSKIISLDREIRELLEKAADLKEIKTKLKGGIFNEGRFGYNGN